MLGRHATVDNANDDVLAVKSLRASESGVSVKKLKKIKAIICCKWPNLVFPDVQDFVHAIELVCLGGMHSGGETIEAEAVAID
jgi:hypothetical protein